MPGARVRTRPRYLPPDRSGPRMRVRLRRGAGRSWYWLGTRFYRACWGPLPQAQSGFSPDQFLLQTLSPPAWRCSRCLAWPGRASSAVRGLITNLWQEEDQLKLQDLGRASSADRGLVKNLPGYKDAEMLVWSCFELRLHIG